MTEEGLGIGLNGTHNAAATAFLQSNSGALVFRQADFGIGFDHLNDAAVGADSLFIDNAMGIGWRFLQPQSVWMRAPDPEYKTNPKILNRAAKVWIAGMKTEWTSTEIEADGGSTEVLGLSAGGQGTPSGIPGDDGQPLFVINNARFSAILGTFHGGGVLSEPYNYFAPIQDIEGVRNFQFPDASLPQMDASGGSEFNLYTNFSNSIPSQSVYSFIDGSSFEAAAAAPNQSTWLPPGWTPNGGNWTVGLQPDPSDHGFCYTQNSTSGMGSSFYGSAAWSNYFIESYFVSLPVRDATGEVGIMGRATDVNNGYLLKLFTANGINSWGIFKVVAGTQTMLLSGPYPYASSNVEAWVAAILQLRFEGPQIMARVRSQESTEWITLGSVRDSTFSSGQMGLYTNNAAVYFEYVDAIGF